MARKWVLGFALLLVLGSFTVPVIAQVSAESAVKGNVNGVVTDPSGAVVPGAKIVLSGPTGTRTATSDGQGGFMFLLLTPGTYSLRVEKEGFKAADLKGIDVVTNRTANLKVGLTAGAVNETVEVNATAITVDTTSSAVSANLDNSFYEKIPVGRGVASIFYIAPGVASGGAVGNSNPSISGGSGLENQYVADGVNITDTAFGGLGTFSRVYGSVGTGINLSFIKEVQVKTGGFEPQYGKTTGGVVQIVTKSGSREFHGGVSAFLAPTGLEAQRLNPDDFNRFNNTGTLQHVSNFDVSGELGGYVPGFRDHLFFFTSFDPSWGNRIVHPAKGSLLFSGGDLERKTTTYNYAAKLTFKLSDKHQLEGSVYGDPATTPIGAFRRLNTDSTSSFSSQDFGSRNVVVRYNATLSPTWLVNASATWAHNHFTEAGFNNAISEITDTTQTGFSSGGLLLPDSVRAQMRGQMIPAGLGFVENTVGNNYGFNLDTSKVFHMAGEHTFSIGYRYEKPIYDGSRTNSGPIVPLPSLNADGNTSGFSSDYLSFANDPTQNLANYNWRLRLASASCTLCPLLNVPGLGNVPVRLSILRSEFGLNSQGFKGFVTSGKYHAVYANDSWSPNKYVTINAGVRWEQQLMIGQNSKYTFTDNWSPRIGVTVDPMGDRKTKIFANFGRYTYAIPLDLAERSLTNELDMFSLTVAPAFTVNSAGQRIATINQFGTVTPVIDAAHVLNGAHGGNAAIAGVSTESGESIHSGTRMSYLDEFVVGAEHEFPGGIVASVKYLHRDLKRIVEDTGGISPEAANAGITQQFSITNVNANTDIFANPIAHTFTPGTSPVQLDATGNPVVTGGSFVRNPAFPAGCTVDLNPASDTGGSAAISLDPVQDTFGATLGAVCFEDTAKGGAVPGSLSSDGVPDGFVNPQRLYWAVEIEVNKAFSKNWLLRTNWRIAKLVGNFEGAFRNDNGQTDPSISSLFDFTPGLFNLLGDQFKVGPLNTDRRHIVNAFFSYYVDHGALKGLTLGPGVQFQTGIPINDLKAHPVYLNAGEVPVNGRGSLGRTPLYGTVDLHAEYSHRVTEKTSMQLGVDLFNIANAKRQLFVDQNEDLSFGQPNIDFKKPANQAVLGDAFQSPFSARVMVKFVF